MQSRVVFLAVLLVAPCPGLAQPALHDGFSWDSGPGRHYAEAFPSHPREAAASRSTLRSPLRSLGAVRRLELSRTIQDGRDRVRARQELRRIERSGRSPRELRGREFEVTAWLRRQERRLESADRTLDLDAAQPGPTDRATLRLEREIARARQRIDLERAARRVKLGPSRVVRRALGPRF
jgi:hypothetical protein